MKLKDILLAGSLLIAAAGANANVIWGSGTLTANDPIDDWYFTVTDASKFLITLTSGGDESRMDLYYDDGVLGSSIGSGVDDGWFDVGSIFKYLGEDAYLLRVSSDDFGGNLFTSIFGGAGEVDYNISIASWKGHAEWTTKDDVSVAEPSTLMLAALGLIGLGVLRHRRTS
ncbi:MAG TPA: PEP-CTERM sorting domain-containing protein [Spongiibacteraceae bacterium]|jgi:hypothetical protein|nr:PEP-CTERM sorting domain-containing protein [Spongiibacteraceae bacterium]HUH36743.1 PEP-CTERM sorting domain-containing protein [Spongiibacteraceae bacterium]